MRHIRQKNSSEVEDMGYIVVLTADWEGSLETHPSIVDYPERFEIVDIELPEAVQYLKYQT